MLARIAARRFDVVKESVEAGVTGHLGTNKESTGR